MIDDRLDPIKLLSPGGLQIFFIGGVGGFVSLELLLVLLVCWTRRFIGRPRDIFKLISPPRHFCPVESLGDEANFSWATKSAQINYTCSSCPRPLQRLGGSSSLLYLAVLCRSF